MSLQDAGSWFQHARRLNYDLRAQQKDNHQSVTGFTSSTGNPWIDSMTESYLNVLARENNTGTSVRGHRAIIPYVGYHSPRRQADVVDEIINHLLGGKIVILDLSAGPIEVRTVLSERIARQIFERSFAVMNAGEVPQNVVIYVEEAHNLIGKKEALTSTWPRIAKEGAKAKIAFVYATQEPSSIHPNILANTENWFVTHLNNDDELRALGKFYDFADFKDSLKTAQDVGFARIKTLSSPFVVPTQINRFTPDALKATLKLIANDKQE
jgi:DNA helicase HerA-like ATPase